ncbi:MAG: response regulator [Thermoleophilia bacterium]|nr:response regulator [Thermoleophilia bacterium]
MGRHARIALCEPHAELRALLTRVLERSGHTVVPCERAGGWDGEPDLLVLNPGDERMLERAHELRRRDPGLPIICISTLAPGERALALGPLAVLAKPFRIAELDQAVALALTGGVTVA